MKILVTGVKGQLGYDIVKILNNTDNDVLGIDINDLDLTDKKATIDYIVKYNPDVIMHNAAYTAVEKAEDDEETCEKVNAMAVSYIVSAAQLTNAKLVYISTDYVFDGTKSEPYEIDDVRNPQSVYGKTKAMGEDFVMQYSRSFIVRISWVFGINGNNFVKTMLRIAETKTDVSVVNDQIGSPTYTADLAVLLCEMIKTEKYGIYHATNEGYCSWYEFAAAIFVASGSNITVHPVSTAEYSFKAKRPANSRMSKQRLINEGFDLLPSWQDALNRYLLELGVKK